MSELVTLIEQMNKKIDNLAKMMHDMQIMQMKDKVNNTWLDENIAAGMVGYHPETFRRKVKRGNQKHEEPWSLIVYRNTRGRNWQYSRKSLIRFQERTSSE